MEVRCDVQRCLHNVNDKCETAHSISVHLLYPVPGSTIDEPNLEFECDYETKNERNYS